VQAGDRAIEAADTGLDVGGGAAADTGPDAVGWLVSSSSGIGCGLRNTTRPSFVTRVVEYIIFSNIPRKLEGNEKNKILYTNICLSVSTKGTKKIMILKS
jgi:hypothetical protein